MTHPPPNQPPPTIDPFTYTRYTSEFTNIRPLRPIHLCPYSLSIHPNTHPSISLNTNPSNLSHTSTHPPIHLSIYLTHPSILPLNHLPVYIILQSPAYIHINLPTHALFTQLPTHQPTTIHSHICLFTQPPSHIYVYT